jgi:hypothetical protein
VGAFQKRAYIPITSWLDKQLFQIACELNKSVDDIANEVLSDYVRDYFFHPKKDEKPGTGN